MILASFIAAFDLFNAVKLAATRVVAHVNRGATLPVNESYFLNRNALHTLSYSGPIGAVKAISLGM